MHPMRAMHAYIYSCVHTFYIPKCVCIALHILYVIHVYIHVYMYMYIICIYMYMYVYYIYTPNFEQYALVGPPVVEVLQDTTLKSLEASQLQTPGTKLPLLPP